MVGGSQGPVMLHLREDVTEKFLRDDVPSDLEATNGVRAGEKKRGASINV
jgi:hypothetical protein